MIITNTQIEGLKKHTTGKVRDVYDLGDNLLVVATDRISAFDVVLPTGIPDKGKVLTQLSLFWFDKTTDIIDNHLVTADIDEIIEYIGKAGAMNPESYREILDGRSMVVVKCKPFPIECVVRGYLTGSAWKEYSALKEAASGAENILLHGIQLPADMVDSQKMPEPIFTPATKEEAGHDVNISAQQAFDIIGEDAGKQLEAASLALYKYAADYALEKDIIICDTKFEFGQYDDKIILIDEALTPDSSRFWDAESYVPGRSQPSFDKQYVRDYLETLDWNKEYPGPELPDDVAKKTSEKYRLAYFRITGKELD
ncbi:MAG: phosphoribosylaminoimidazolesuccinocarboxamide synthase [Armatimonadota bacterium]